MATPAYSPRLGTLPHLSVCLSLRMVVFPYIWAIASDIGLCEDLPDSTWAEKMVFKPVPRALETIMWNRQNLITMAATRHAQIPGKITRTLSDSEAGGTQ